MVTCEGAVRVGDTFETFSGTAATRPGTVPVTWPPAEVGTRPFSDGVGRPRRPPTTLGRRTVGVAVVLVVAGLATAVAFSVDTVTGTVALRPRQPDAKAAEVGVATVADAAPARAGLVPGETGRGHAPQAVPHREVTAPKVLGTPLFLGTDPTVRLLRPHAVGERLADRPPAGDKGVAGWAGVGTGASVGQVRPRRLPSPQASLRPLAVDLAVEDWTASWLLSPRRDLADVLQTFATSVPSRRG